MLVNQANVASIFKGFQVVFSEAYQGVKDLIWMQIAMRTVSNSESEDYDWLGSIPGMRELLDEVIIKNLSAHKWMIVNKEWEDTIGLKQTLVERDSYGLLNPLIQTMGQVARQQPDILVSDLLVNGFDTLCYTGKNFFDTDHEPVKGGTKFSNVGTKKLSADNWNTARTSLKGRKNSAGRAMGIGRDLVLCVSPENERLAKTILVAEKTANGADNMDRGTGRPLVIPELSGDNKNMWFVLETGYPIRPLIVQIEKEPSVYSVTNPNDSYVVIKHAFIQQVYGRWNAGYGLPEFAWGSDGSQAA